MGILDGIIDKLGLEKKKTETTDIEFIKTVAKDLEQAGFRMLIKNEVLANRLAEMKSELEKISLIINSSDATTEQKKLAIESLYNLFQADTASWLRLLENKNLRKKINMFLLQYISAHDLESHYYDLIAEGRSIIALFSNIDVEPLPPIIIHTQKDSKVDARTYHTKGSS